MVPVPKSLTNFGLVDKLLFGPTRSLKFSDKLHKCIGSAYNVHSGMIYCITNIKMSRMWLILVLFVNYYLVWQEALSF